MDWYLYLIWLAILSVFTFILYGYDKAQSKMGGSRVPELFLHGFALLGGFPGGWVGRAIFRHKTKKKVFLVVLGLSTAIHLGLVYWVIFK
jgi:uncharacterized membrane protein YsdA (DUF1294 family)